MHIKNCKTISDPPIWQLYFATPLSQNGLINTEIVNHLL